MPEMDASVLSKFIGWDYSGEALVKGCRAGQNPGKMASSSPVGLPGSKNNQQNQPFRRAILRKSHDLNCSLAENQLYSAASWKHRPVFSGFTNFLRPVLAHFYRFLGITHGKYSTSTQARSSGSQAKRTQFEPAFDIAYSNQSCS
jgi:hypothetical protein